MSDQPVTPPLAATPLPADDLSRTLTVALPDGQDVPHVFVVGDTYSILVSGAQTNGRYCLIDMLVHDGGGPPLHRHDFEEMFTVLEGELEFTFRGESRTIHAPTTVNIPANAPHSFKNKSGRTVHMLCMCTPAGLEELFLATSIPLASRNSPPPQVSAEEQARMQKLAFELAPKYRSEILRQG